MIHGKTNSPDPSPFIASTSDILQPSSRSKSLLAPLGGQRLIDTSSSTASGGAACATARCCGARGSGGGIRVHDLHVRAVGPNLICHVTILGPNENRPSGG